MTTIKDKKHFTLAMLVICSKFHGAKEMKRRPFNTKNYITHTYRGSVNTVRMTLTNSSTVDSPNIRVSANPAFLAA